jgi:ketosteroid isomerase-like protein
VATSEAMQVLQRLFELYDRRDFAAYEELLSPDLVWEFNTMDAPSHGRQAEMQVAHAVAEAFPDAEFVRDHFVEDDTGWIAYRLRVRATNTGPWQGRSPTGRSIDIAGASHVRVQDGKVVELRYVTDRLAMMRQLGFLPPPG